MEKPTSGLDYILVVGKETAQWIEISDDQEGTMRPNVTHFHQMRVSRVNRAKDGKSWAIVFENGGQIVNEDPEIVAPNGLEDLTLLTTILTSHDVTLKFGVTKVEAGQTVPDYQQDVVLGTTTYRIEDDRFPGGLHYPGVPEELGTPVEPTGRAAEAPEGSQSGETAPEADEG